MSRELFGRLQQESTLHRYAAYMANLVAFLLRSVHKPVPVFPVHMSDELVGCLRTLSSTLMSKAEDNKEPFHAVIIAFLMEKCREVLKDESKHPFNLFLLTSHMVNDVGKMKPVQQFTPDIAKIEWCLRASAGYQLQHISAGQEERMFE